MVGRRFGIEEEFVLLDETTWEPVDRAAQAVARLTAAAAGAVVHEFFPSQIEHATTVCATAEQALDEVTTFRRRLGAWAQGAGVVAAGTGTPPRLRRDAAPTTGRRYDRITRDIAGLAGEHQINGLHVHLAIGDRDEGIAISNALRPWLPVLLALSGNSPCWAGRDTGFASWRTVHTRRWTTCGIPPLFRDAADYDATVASLTGIGATSDAGTINWTVRLSRRHPTVEVRVCDAQLDPHSSVALALLVRALAETATDGGTMLHDTGPQAHGDAALWHAARHGVTAELVHPRTGRLAPASRVLRVLCAHAAPHLADAHERHLVERFLQDALDHGAGAEQQRRALHGGPAALSALYRERLAAECQPTAASTAAHLASFAC